MLLLHFVDCFSIQHMKVFLAPRLINSRGGPSSFQSNLINYLSAHGSLHTFEFCKQIDVVLLINGSKNIPELLSLWLAGIPIVIRLGSKYRSNLFESKSLSSRIDYLFKHLLILFGILLSRVIVFQSYTVLNEWSSNPLIRSKKSFVIYNPSIHLAETSNSKDAYIASTNIASNTINLIALEAHHPSPTNSFPLAIFHTLKAKGYQVNLHVFGVVPDSWSPIIFKFIPDITSYGYIDYEAMVQNIQLLYCPIYVPSDIFPCGCPNAMIEMLSLGIPTLTYDNTAGAELVQLCGGGLTLPGFSPTLRALVFPNFDLVPESINKILKNYVHYSSAAQSLNISLSADNTLSKYLAILAQAHE